MTQDRSARAIRLIAVDLDGTLLTSEKVLAAEGAHLLSEAAAEGTRVVLATTRNPYAVLPLCRALQIDDPIICSNGAQVWGSPEGPIWACHAIPRAAALEIARLADARGWELSTTVGETTYWRQRRGRRLGPYADNVMVVARNADAVVGDPVRVLTWEPDAAEAIGQLCRERLVGQCRTETYYAADGTFHALGVFARQADKGTALALVLQKLGLEPEGAMAIGDNLNDVPMFNVAGVSVAMANAPDEVRRRATAVAPRNDEEGVAWAIRAFGVA